MNILISGIQSALIAFALWFAISYFHTHAILKNPFEDGYCTLIDLLLIAFVTGLMLGAMK